MLFFSIFIGASLKRKNMFPTGSIFVPLIVARFFKARFSQHGNRFDHSKIVLLIQIYEPTYYICYI